MSAGLPETFWFRERRPGAITLVAKRSENDRHRYIVSRPDRSRKSATLGIMTIMPDGTRKRDGAGYKQGVMLGRERRRGEAFWKPLRQIDDPNAESVSVRRGVDSHGEQVVKLVFRMNNRQTREIVLPHATAKQLYAQLLKTYGPRYG